MQLTRHMIVGGLAAALVMSLACSPGPTEEPAATTSTSALNTVGLGQLKRLNVQSFAFIRNHTVNVVLVGFDGRIDDQRFLSLLPTHNSILHNFSYNFMHTPAWFNDALFNYLRAIAVPQPEVALFPNFPPQRISQWQFYYNWCNADPVARPNVMCDYDPATPRVNQRMITQNHLIDANQVEKVLSYVLGPFFGLDVQNPTVVLINWWGRPDFIDHTYVNVAEPDPDTGFQRGFRPAWDLAGIGGTAADDPESCGDGSCLPHRLWFHDLSAGPFGRNGSWDLIGSEVRVARSVFAPFNGIMDYRIHHMADYENQTGRVYRSLDTLTEDLSERLIGDVFLGGMITPLALYDPALTPPLQPKRIQLDINRYSWDFPNSFSGSLNPQILATKMSKLPYEFSVEVTEQPDSRTSPLGSVYDCFRNINYGYYAPGSCYGNRVGGLPIADLYLYFHDHIAQFVEGHADYELPIFQFNVLRQDTVPFIGYADGNHAWPESQSFVYTVMEEENNAWYGHTTLIAHEAGHHFGLSHPHNGSRCLDQYCYDLRFMWADDSTYYAWNGDHTDGLMTYNNVNTDYSRFERDNEARYLSNTYVSLAIALFDRLLQTGDRVGKVVPQILAADGLIGEAMQAIAQLDEETAVAKMRASYDLLVQATSTLKIPLAPDAFQVNYRVPVDSHQIYKEWARMAAIDSTADRFPSVIAGMPPSTEALTGPVEFPEVPFDAQAP